MKCFCIFLTVVVTRLVASVHILTDCLLKKVTITLHKLYLNEKMKKKKKEEEKCGKKTKEMMDSSQEWQVGLLSFCKRANSSHMCCVHRGSAIHHYSP